VNDEDLYTIEVRASGILNATVSGRSAGKLPIDFNVIFRSNYFLQCHCNIEAIVHGLPRAGLKVLNNQTQ
jgi:hypothetical protein